MSAARSLTLFGGTGFIGRAILRRLAHRPPPFPLEVIVASRHPPAIPVSSPGLQQVTHTCVDIRHRAAVQDAVKIGADAVNLVGLLYETPRKGISFEGVQAEGPLNIVEAVAANRGGRVVHISAIGANEGARGYAGSKGKGEKHILERGQELGLWTAVLRPSIVWGPGDSFFNRFKSMARFAPGLPLIGGGKTRYQPVFVEDVADAVIKCLGYHPAKDNEAKAEAGNIYELGGPDVFTFRQLMEMTLKYSDMRRLLIPVPFSIASLMGAASEALHYVIPQVPPALTRDQVEMLKSDNIVSATGKTFKDLGITPAGLNAAMLTYLSPKH